MKKKLLILTVGVACILVMFCYQDTFNVIEKKSHTHKNIAIEKEIKQKQKQQPKNVSDNNLSSMRTKDKDELFFENLSIDDKISYSFICFEIVETENGFNFYPLTSEHLINQFIKTQEQAGLTPTQKQLSMVKSFYKKCTRLSAFTEAIQKDFIGNHHQDENGTGLLTLKLNDLWDEKKYSEVINVATKNLMSTIQQERMDALFFLTGRMNWPGAINDELNIRLSSTESRDFFNTAVQMLECEYGVTDCGVNSLYMFNGCSMMAESCGMSVLEFLRYTHSGFEMTYVYKYIDYLKSLGIL